MIRPVLAATLLGCLLLVPAAAARAVVRVDQKTYVVVSNPAFKGLVYLYAEDIESTNGQPGFRPFMLHILVGRYRAPLLGSKGFLLIQDLERLLSKRPDVWRDRMNVSQPSGQSKQISPPGMQAFTVRIQKVVPERSGTDHVLVDIP